jgi:NAD(P)-dependent dehydrogenase (short-subunit alcohol dehydrogenase family)
MANQRRNAIVTGAASGLGRALAVRLAREEWHVALCDINDVGCDETLGLVRGAGGTGEIHRLDVTDPAAWQELAKRLRQGWSQLDLLVNNAGVSGAGEVGEFALEDWHWMVGVNLYNAIYGCHTFVPWLKQNPRGGHIINTASLAAIGSAPGMAAYNVSKAGVLSLSETLYTELAPHNVGVTVLCPAFFPTNLLTNGRFTQNHWKRVAERAFEVSTMTADYVADQAVRAIKRKQLYLLLPVRSRRQWWLKRLMPTVFLRQVAKIMRGAAERVAASDEKPEAVEVLEPAAGV